MTGSRRGGFGATLALALVLGALFAPSALANYVYWPNTGGSTIGRAGLDGSGATNSFLTTTTHPSPDSPTAVAIDSQYIYWAYGDSATGAIGRAKLDGTDIQPNFIPHTSIGTHLPYGVAVTGKYIYWTNADTTGSIGRANIDGSQPNNSFVTGLNNPCGLAVDNNFLYWVVNQLAIGRVPIGGGTPNENFIPVPAGKDCGVAVDPSHIYWDDNQTRIGRANLDGSGVQHNFIKGQTAAYSVAVTPQYIYWGGGFTTHTVGRANIDGTSPNEDFVTAGSGNSATPYLLAASPTDTFTVGKPKLNKKSGTAKVSVSIPGPGTVVADAASKGTQAVASKKKNSSTVKRVQKSASVAATLTLKIRANGKALKALTNRHKAKVKVGITFTPQGTAGVPALTTKKLVLKRS